MTGNAAFQQTSVEQDSHLPFREDVQEVMLRYIRSTDFKRLLHQFSTQVETTGSRTVAVMSMHPGEGKSFLVSSLALAFAQYMGARVLIVDSVSQTQNGSLYFQGMLGDRAAEQGGAELGRGRVEVLSTQSFFPDENYDTADFRIGQHIRELGASYELVLLDTCSIQAASERHLDPLILARNSDAALVLTSKRSLSSGVILQLDQLVNEFQINILGTVHNKWSHT